MKNLKRTQSNFAITTVNSQNYSVKFLMLTLKFCTCSRLSWWQPVCQSRKHKRYRFNSWVGRPLKKEMVTLLEKEMTTYSCLENFHG